MQRAFGFAQFLVPLDDAGRPDPGLLSERAPHYLRVNAALLVSVSCIVEFLLGLSMPLQLLLSIPLVPSALVLGLAFGILRDRGGLGGVCRALLGIAP